MYRLQIYLKSTGDDGPILKFLHITNGEVTIKQLLYDAAARFKAVYPSQGRLAVVRVQDSSGCDLDPGFLVDQVCSKNDELYFFTDKKFPTVFKRVLNPAQSPAKKRKSLEASSESPIKPTKEKNSSASPKASSQANSPPPPQNEVPPQQTPTPAARNANSLSNASLGSQKKAVKQKKAATKSNDTTAPREEPVSPPTEPQSVVEATTVKPPVPKIGPNLIEDSQSSSIESIKMPPPPPVIQETPDKGSGIVSQAVRPSKREDTPAIPRTRAATRRAASSTPQFTTNPAGSVDPEPSNVSSYNEVSSQPAAETEDLRVDEDTTASESSDDEVSGPVKAVEMPKIIPPVTRKMTPRRPDLKVTPKSAQKSASPPPKQPSGPAAPEISLPKPARKSLSNLSKLESLRNIDVHDGPKKNPTAKKQEASDSEGLSTDKSSDSSSSSSDGDSSSESENERPVRKPRRSTLLSSMIGKK